MSVKKTRLKKKKTTSRKSTTHKRSKKKTTSHKTSKPKKTIKRVVKKTTTKKKPVTRANTSSTNRRLGILLKEIKDLHNYNRELTKKITTIQEEKQQFAQPTPSRPEIVKNDFVETEKQERQLLTKLREMISKTKKEEHKVQTTQDETINKKPLNQDPTHTIKQNKENKNSSKDSLEKLKEVEGDFTIDEQAPLKNIDIHLPDSKTTTQLTKEVVSTPATKQEDFQSTRKRGLLSIEDAEEYSAILREMIFEINKVFIGQTNVVEKVIISLMCDAHTLLEGVPGLAKSLLIETLKRTVEGTTFERIQFLPDLLPSDIIGGQIFNPKTAQFVTHKGPIFANFVLADEINRAPPKTHAAIMEAMQEKKINIENDEFILDRPFLVLATQNPLENKGTYALPEAVLDRFMFKVFLDYPKRKDELSIITENATTKKDLHKKLKPVLDKKTLIEIQNKVKQVYISDKIREYILDLIEATRGINKKIEGVRYLKYGAGVRASIYLGVAAKAKAVIEGRNYVLPEDIAYVLPDIFRHRLSLNYRGKAHDISVDKIIQEIIMKVPPV